MDAEKREDGYFYSRVMRVIEDRLNEMADAAIQTKCSEFEKELIGMKAQIVAGIMNGMELMLQSDPINHRVNVTINLKNL